MEADFSPLFDQTSGLVQWSPDGRYMATAVGQRLVVRNATQCLEIIKGGRKPFQDKIEALEWASDSDLLLCALYKHSLVEVSSMSRPEWRCRIREGMAGLVRAQWAPDARHVITFSDFNLYMSVWSLTTRQMHTVRQPKAAPGCLAFSPDSKVVAVATRKDCRDIVRLYTTSTWESLGEFTAETLDLCNLEWSPDGSALCLQDISLEYRMLFYSPAGELLGRLEAYSNALGVKHSLWSPDGKLLSIGSYDQCARLVSPVTWKPVAVLKHMHPRTRPDGAKVACFREVPLGCEREEDSEIDKENDVDLGCSVTASSVRTKVSLHTPSVSSFAKGRAKGGKDAACSVSRHLSATSTLKPRISGKGVDITYALSLPGPIPEQKPSLSKPFPRLGVGQLMSWSSDGRYLATRNDNMVSSIWVWDAEDLALSSLVVQLEAVRSAKWCPTRNTLAICTGNNHIYFWTAEGASWVDAPLEDMEIIGFRWSPDGKSLLVLSKDSFCCCFLKESDDLSLEQKGEESCKQEDDVGSRTEVRKP